MELVLADLEPRLCAQFEKAFKGVDNVRVHYGRFEDVKFDCVVSAANSFGLMDGGVDGAITKVFGEQLMKRVQDKIIKDYAGEQPVGTSFIIRATEEVHIKNQYVAHTPTMTVPKDIRHTNNVYMAMKAMLIAVNKHNEDNTVTKIETLVCTGLGTFCGRVPFETAANDMRLAYDHVKNPPKKLDWDFARIRNNELFLNKIKP